MNSPIYTYQIFDQLLLSLNSWYSERTFLNHLDITNSSLFYTSLVFYENWFWSNFPILLEKFITETYVFDLFNYSIPNIKLYYPEPFIATPSYIHDDIWFIHIVIYQYWLWFFFISLIVFFFISYLIAIRWNNVRFRPNRETRGVSRSKCGDLITATVPVTWASSIIIHESTDAIEFYDGFGSTEMAVGIRAYQWGWEYYYPRNLDLLDWNNTKTLHIGQSLMYPNNNNDRINQHVFKNFNYLNTVSQNNTSLIYLWSSWNTSNKQLLLNNTFGLNRLINNTATLLLSTSKIHNVNTYFLFANTINKYYVFNLYNVYRKFIFNNIHVSQPCVIWNQLFIINSLTLYTTLVDATINYNIKLFWNYLNQEDNNWFIFNNQFTTFSDYFLLKWRDCWLNYNLVDGDNNALLSKWNYEYLIWNQLYKNNNFLFYLFAEQDFKQWTSHELFEDITWDLFFIHKNFYLIFINYSNSDSVVNNLVDVRSCKYVKQGNSHFFNDFSNYEDEFVYPFMWYSIWQVSFYTKSQLLYLNSLLWVIDTFVSSFAKFKWNQYLIWSSNNNYSLSLLYNIKFLSIYELLYFYSTQISTYWILQNVLIHNNSKQLIYNLSTNYSLISKLWNTTNNSFWKSFKLLFHEEKSLFNFKFFSNNYQILPHNTNQLILLNTIQKNSLTFVSSIVFKNSLRFDNTYVYNIDFIWTNLINFFPFYTSVESDIIRYIWFDWYTVRSCIITKSIDTSLYNLNGALGYSYNFTQQPLITLLNKTDNFFIKYTHARKLYLPVYTYLPFYYTNIFKIDNNLDLLFHFKTNYSYWNIQYMFLTLSLWFDSDFISLNYWYNFNNNLSFISSPSHGFSLISSIFNVVDLLTHLNDILVKRNYLLLYLNARLNIYSIPASFQLTWKNPLTQLLKYTTSQRSVEQINSVDLLNSSIPSILYFYLQNYKNLNDCIQHDLTKSILFNPYQPLRKGITNMIRIHADKAVAMPIDTRLQLLAVSKDIIHSWAIPSAGIKIDCIPGYSSHRIAIFLLSGIYWGQCMEICGRFHHWMPIVVYFIRRDLFCLWCIHFIFINKQGLLYNQSFELYNSYSTPFTALSTNYWLYELTD